MCWRLVTQPDIDVEAFQRDTIFGRETKGLLLMDMKPAQALTLWHSTTLAQVHGADPDLTTRQTAILLTIYLEAPPHTVRGLAAKLDVTKPVITRALDTMGIMGLLSRRRDERDRRNVPVQRTVKGSEYLERLGALVADHAADLS